jgi:hypothetical protein
MAATKFGQRFRRQLEFIRDYINRQLGDPMTKSELDRNSRYADRAMLSLDRVITRESKYGKQPKH